MDFIHRYSLVCMLLLFLILVISKVSFRVNSFPRGITSYPNLLGCVQNCAEALVHLPLNNLSNHSISGLQTLVIGTL